MAYKIIHTAKFESQLRDIISYIEDVSGSSKIALDFFDGIDRAIQNLTTFPYMGSKPRNYTLRKMGYLVLIVGGYLVFYKVNETTHTVVLYALFHGKQEYGKLV